jgi:hypothetical protein
LVLGETINMGKKTIKTTHDDLTILYYTSNFLEDTNPYFLANTKRILKDSIGETALISISHKPMSDMGENICVGDIGRSNRNIYWQILQGAKSAKTKFVATAEDDVLYTPSHYQCRPSKDNILFYNMNKWSIFTWSKPMVYSWRHRKIIFGLVCLRTLLIDCLEERLEKYPKYDSCFCGEPGRYEDKLKITPRDSEEGWSDKAIVVFSHPHALGYVTIPPGRERVVGENKALGPLRGTELVPWGLATETMKLWDKDYSEQK